LNEFVPVISSNSIKCEVREAGIPEGRPLVVATGPTAGYSSLNGVELVLADSNDSLARVHGLAFFVCRHNKVIVSVHAGPMPPPAIEPAKDMEFALLPFYWQAQQHRPPSAYSMKGYLNPRNAVGTLRGSLMMPQGQRGRPQVQHHRVELISQSFDHSLSLHVDFRASQWPGNVDEIQGLIKSAIDTFVAYIAATQQ
jgi:hypothetical protein